MAVVEDGDREAGAGDVPIHIGHDLVCRVEIDKARAIEADRVLVPMPEKIDGGEAIVQGVKHELLVPAIGAERDSGPAGIRTGVDGERSDEVVVHPTAAEEPAGFAVLVRARLPLKLTEGASSKDERGYCQKGSP